MIAFVRGEVAAVTLNSAVLEVGGVGLELMCTPGTLATLRTGQAATLPTSMVVREDSLTIFGFLDDDTELFPESVVLTETTPGSHTSATPRTPRPSSLLTSAGRLADVRSATCNHGHFFSSIAATTAS